MSNYYYRGRSQAGEEVVGKIAADNEDAVVNVLRDKNIIPVDIKKIKEEASTINLDIGKYFKKKSVPYNELIMFSRQMYSLTKAGIPLIRAMKGLADTTTCEPLAEALGDVVRGLESGQSLATAMQGHPHVFSPLYLSMIHVGENTGRLDEAFIQIAIYIENDVETRKRIQQAVRYPFTVIGFVAIAIVVINIFVIPKFANMFNNLKQELPTPTVILINTSNFFVDYWKFLLFLLVLGIVGFKYWVSTPKGELKWDEIRLKFPLIGNIIYEATLARFARTFSMMISSGVPLMSSLTVVSNVVDNAFIGSKIRDMRNGIERGESITRNARESNMFSPLVLQMVAVGEESGAMDSLLKEVADYYEREVDYKVKKLSDAVEPILIVCVGIMVLVLALGVFLPLWQLTDMAK